MGKYHLIWQDKIGISLHMFHIRINPHLEIGTADQPAWDTSALLKLLMAIEQTGSIAQAANAAGLSYRNAWGLLRDVEGRLGTALISKERGRGTGLTPVAEKLIWADRRIAARLSPLLASLASELENELSKTVGIKSRAVRLDASHGFAVAALLKYMDAAKVPIELRYRNSTDAVAALSRQECDLAGFHVPMGDFERPVVARYARWLKAQKHCLIHLASRSLGLFVAAGNPKGIHGLRDLARSDVRFVNRQAGSGTRMVLELMLAGLTIDPGRISDFENGELTHSAVAAFIASGMGDVGMGVQTAARQFGLDFIPLVRERYFFALPSALVNDPSFKEIRHIMQSDAFRADVDALPGYDAADTGKLLALPEAFSHMSA
jgi:molybdate transport repressor ModE-like protein